MQPTTTITSFNTSSSLNYSQSQIDQYLQQLDYENAQLMIPTLVYIGILILTGLFGNILVIVVYYFRFKPTTCRIFIISLALFDLMNNTLAQPGEILDITYSYRFTNNHLCKLKRFFNYFTTLCSVFCLLVVAVDRYRKICKAVRRQMTVRIAKILVGGVALCSVAITMPSLMLNGVKKIPTDIPGVMGTECKYADNFQNAIFPKVFLGFQFLLFLSCLTVMICLYSLIGRIVFRHSKFNLGNKLPGTSKPTIAVGYTIDSSSGSTGTTTTSPDVAPTEEDNEDDRAIADPEETLVDQNPDMNAGVDLKVEKSQVINTYPSDILEREHNAIRNATKASPGFDKLVIKAVHQEKKEKVTQIKTRTTLMLFVITLVFIVSYLPYLSISIVKLFNKHFVDSLSVSAFMVYNVVLRSHYINAAVNPLVYSFCNAKFRQEAKHVLFPWRRSN